MAKAGCVSHITYHVSLISMSLLIITGPTASGKTNLAVSLAKKFDGELISADSRQVYRGMNIGTGKDLQSYNAYNVSRIAYRGKEVALPIYSISDVPIWLYDVVAPNEEFSVSHYRALATHAIQEIQKKNKLPIVVGGTGLYIQSIIGDMETIDIGRDESLRKTVESYDLLSLQQMLQTEDAVVWEKLNESDRKNPRRLVRKIEITRWQKSHEVPDPKKDSSVNAYTVGLTASLPYLYTRIDERVESRMKAGMKAEIITLLEKGYGWDLEAFNTLGYKAVSYTHLTLPTIYSV